MSIAIDRTDARLLDCLQRGIALASRPFDIIGSYLSIEPAEVLSRTVKLKADGTIRQISAIFDSAALGYKGSLAGFRVKEDRLDEVAASVAAHPGVSHCYSRDADYNLWFTITVAPGSDFEQEISSLAERSGVESYLVLPALRLFKIGVFLRMGGEENDEPSPRAVGSRSSIELSSEDKSAIRVLQEDIPLIETPFAELAARAGMSEEELLQRANRLQESGAMRRFAAVLRHTRAGYGVNAMVCWRVPPDEIGQIGETLAQHLSVSHCYERPTSTDWPYPLYTMVHCRTESELERIVHELALSAGTSDYRILRSLREYKKSRVLYFV